MRTLLPILVAALFAVPSRADTRPEHPRLEYRPVLQDYAPYREAELLDWRRANDTVGHLGGHGGHAQSPAAGQGGGEASGRQPAQGKEKR